MSEQDAPEATSPVAWFREQEGKDRSGEFQPLQVEVVGFTPGALDQLIAALRDTLVEFRMLNTSVPVGVDNMSGLQTEAMERVLSAAANPPGPDQLTLASTCAWSYCGHTLNWHSRAEGCHVTTCGCTKFAVLRPEDAGPASVQLVDSRTGDSVPQRPAPAAGWVLCPTPGCSKRAGHLPPCDQLAPNVSVHRRTAMAELAERRAGETAAMAQVPIPPPSPGGNCPVCQVANPNHADWCPRRPAS
jgi:hypothetical protein